MFWYRRLLTCIRYRIYTDYLKGQSGYGVTESTLALKLGTSVCHDVEDFFPQKMFIRYRTYIGQRVRIKSHFGNYEQLLKRLDIMIQYLNSGGYIKPEDKLVGLNKDAYPLSEWFINKEGYVVNIETFWEEFNKRIKEINRLSLACKEASIEMHTYYCRCFLSTLIDIPEVIKALYKTIWEK